MLLIKCPYCQLERAEIEFMCVGEAHLEKPVNASDAEWEKFLYLRTNTRGVHFERWYHVHGCARFFNAARDTTNDRFLTTYRAGLPKPVLSP